MESKHETRETNTPDQYQENYCGFTVTLLSRSAGVSGPAGPMEWRAVASEAVSWHSSWRTSWVRALAEVRGLVDRYLEARAACARIQARRELAAAARTAGAGAVEFSPRRPVVR